MRCAYHSTSRTSVQCRTCGRPLCPLCDHRIKGFAYCQDCIVRGVEMLRFASRPESTSSRSSRPSPTLAAAVALIPGLGAVYNRQNAKAFVHFILICGLFELAELSGLTLFGLGGVVFYLYSIVDAYRTAQAIRTGANPKEQDERLRRFLQENVRTWAGILIALGIIFLVTDVFRLFTPPIPLLQLWPLLLIGLALYLLIRNWRADRNEDALEPPSTDFRVMTPSLFSPPTGRLTGPVDRQTGSSWPNYSEGRRR
ncbi:MAG: hypothetical protein HY314_13395 [Acidobacteria bacterium]|nr:hypothetical protein [Acidobacteriota bacterium]